MRHYTLKKKDRKLKVGGDESEITPCGGEALTRRHSLHVRQDYTL